MSEKTPAQIAFGKNTKRAHALVKSGKAKNLKEAWAIIKAEKPAVKTESTVTAKKVFYNGLW